MFIEIQKKYFDEILFIYFLFGCYCYSLKRKCLASKIGVSKYIKQILMDIKKKIDSNTATVGDFNTTLSSKGRPSRQKINKEKFTLNDKLEHMNLIDF